MYLNNNDLIFTSNQKEYFSHNIIQNKTVEINIEEYCEILFGSYNYKLRNLLENAISITSDKIYITYFQNSDLLIYHKNGELIEKKNDFFEGFTPFGITVNENKNEIWAATGSGQILMCKDLSTNIIKSEIGQAYEDSSELSFPENVHFFNNEIYISEMGNKRILKISVENLEKKVHLHFEEPVWNFTKNELNEIVLLDSGIYKIVNKKLIKIEI